MEDIIWIISATKILGAYIPSWSATWPLRTLPLVHRTKRQHYRRVFN